MSNIQSAYAIVTLVSFLLAIVFFFIDGALLWSIGFFSLAVILVLLKIMWGISGWADNVTRNLGDDSR